MAKPSGNSSQIREFFAGTTVFLTGATGFVGKILLEKLLRTCADVERIYVLIRAKKGRSPEKRLEELLDLVLFDRLKSEQPNFLAKLTMMEGDCALPELGLCNEDKHRLIADVNCVFHVAATVRFDERLRTAAYINVRASKDLLTICKQMPQLKAFVYVSTAYSNCVRSDIKEEFYEPTITGDDLLTVIDMLSDDLLDQITPALVGEWPNTYAFTKAVAEEVVQTYSKGLPVVVVRPSVVIGTVEEPVSGWIDNVYGATGVFLGAALGLVRTLHCNTNYLSDMVPADYFVNCTIAAAWDIATHNHNHPTISNATANNQREVPPIIYNYVSSVQKPITWGQVTDVAERQLKQVPSKLQIWHNFFIPTSSYLLYRLLLILLHRIPAYLMDFSAKCLGKPALMVKGYQKIEKFLHVLSYFTTQQWRFSNDNTQGLWKKLSWEDRRSFPFDLGSFNWESFFYTYARGGRLYLLKDPLDTLREGKRKYLINEVAHYSLIGLLVLGFWKMVMVAFDAWF